MSSYAIQHPDRSDIWAHFGWDHVLDIFVEITEEGRTVLQYDRRHPRYDYKAGALELFLEWGFFTHDELHHAASAIGFLLPEEFEDPRLGTCARVLVDLQQAGDE